MIRFIIVSIGFFSIFYNALSFAKTEKELLNVLSPTEGSEIISKKPEIKVEFAETVKPETIVVLFDGTDVTQLIKFTEKGFEFKPFMVVQPGSHTIAITAQDKEGKQIEKTFSFKTRHSDNFDEAWSNNNATIIYQGILKKPDSLGNLPDSKIEGNLSSDTKLKNQTWEFTFNTNLRYFDQSEPLAPPQKKGYDIVNWILTGTYTKDSFKAKTSIGDIQITETPYTISGLSRKGGLFNFEYDIFQLNAFTVKSEAVYGSRGGTGIETSNNDHIMGLSAGLKLFDKKMEIKTVYITGGEPSTGFGISGTGGNKQGEVLGFLLISNFFENKLNTDFELDFSRYDPDSSDEFGKSSDKAYRAKFYGTIDRYNYEAMYEYIGRDYQVVGNTIQKDREGLSLKGGANWDWHSLNLSLSRYNDNVRGDELFPRIYNTQFVADYSFNKIPELPMGLNYQKFIQKSTKEPEATTKINTETDTLSGRISYVKDKLNIGFTTAYSVMNDKTEANNDTTSVTYTFTPAYNDVNYSVSTSFSLNQSKVKLTGVRTDSYATNLDLKTKFLNQKATFDVAGTYTITKANDGLTNTRNLNGTVQLAYDLAKFVRDYLKPVIALKATYSKITDKISSSNNRDEFVLYLVFTSNIPFSF